MNNRIDYKIPIYNNLIEENMKQWVEYGYDGKSQKIGIIDSGINRKHPLIDRLNIVEERDFTYEGLEDTIGHGTQVALCATLNGLLKFDIYSAKVLDEDGECNEKAVSEALLWLESCNVDMINMSLGFERDKLCGGTCVVCKTINQIISRNEYINICAAAGNKNDTIYCPATNPNVMSCGSLFFENGKVKKIGNADFYTFAPDIR